MADGSLLVDQVIPRRTAALHAAASFGAYLSSSEDSDEHADADGPRRRRRKNTKKVSGSINNSAKTRNSAGTSNLSKIGGFTVTESVGATHNNRQPPLSSASASAAGTRPRPPPRRRSTVPKKASLSLKLDDNDTLSDLTSVSSSSRPSPHPSENKSPSPPLPPSKFERDLAPFPISLESGPSSPPMPTFPYLSQPESWKLDTLGIYVWVLVEEKGMRVFEPGQDELKERIWWPGKIKDSSQNTPLKIHLYGSKHTIKINNPSERNVLSYKDSLGYPRFLLPTFIPPPNLDLDEGIYTSPRKKQKRDRGSVEARWSSAVVEMQEQKESELDSDHLPEVGEAFAYTHLYSSQASASVVPPSSSASPSKNQGKSKGKERGKKRKFEDSEEEGNGDSGFTMYEDQRIHEDEGLDEELEIPGELTLARYTKGTDYWPARVEAYLPPKGKKKQGKYQVTYLDGKTKVIPRSWFFTMEEPRFSSCKLGKWDSAHADHINDVDDGAFHRPRSPSPELPNTNYTPTADEFSDLPLRVQFSYTKPVLQAVLNEQYAPARNRHDAYLAGRKARNNVARGAALKGRMSAKEVEVLHMLVSWWCLRDGVRATGIGSTEYGDDMKLLSDEKKMGCKDDGTDEVGVLEGDVDAEGDTDAEGEPDVDEDSSHLKQGELAADENGHTDMNAMREETSPCDTEPAALLSSPLELPPSSSFSPLGDARFERESSFRSLGRTSSFMTLDSVAATEPYTISEGADDLGTIEEDLDGDSVPPPQKGCEGYERLSGVEKVDYCLNILLPEAIIQILLWRSGHRTSLQLLSEAEEERLHGKGEELLEERDWVFDILRIRNLKENSKKNQVNDGKKAAPISLSGRPRRNANAPDYRE